MKKSIFLAGLIAAMLLSCFEAEAQPGFMPYEIKAKQSYKTIAGIEFPKKIGTFRRMRIFGYDAEKFNVGALYKMGENYVSIYVFPAGDGIEGRLRDHFEETVQSISGTFKYKNHLSVQSSSREMTSFQQDGYTIPCLRADIFGDISDRGQSVIVYECGEFYFKVRITTARLDFDYCHELDTLFTGQIVPSRIVEQFPLRSEMTINLPGPESGIDTTLISAITMSALARAAWIDKNTDEKSRMAGVPDWSLDLQRESYETFAATLNSVEEKSPEAQEYSNLLNDIIEAGFLNEYILEAYDGCLDIPPHTELRYEDYDVWKENYTGNFYCFQWNRNIIYRSQL